MTALAHVHGTLLCGTCESPLELRCPSGCNPEPFATGPVNAAEELRRLRRELREANSLISDLRENNRKYCNQNQDLLSERLAMAEVIESVERHGVPRRKAVFQPRPCDCGATFTPTGPNVKRCPKCRGLA